MKLGDTAKRAFESAYLDKLISIREDHDQEMKKISWTTHISAVIGDEPRMIEVSPTERVNLYVSQVKRYAKNIINARIDAFIEIHKMVGECPDREDVADFKRDLGNMARSFIDTIKPAYEHPLAPYTTPELKEQILQALDQELQAYPGMYVHRLDRFVYESLLLKERGLPIGGGSNGVTNNIVNVGRDVNGPIQAGADGSSQIVAQTQRTIQSELSGQGQERLRAPLIDDSAKAKITDKRKNRTLLIIEIYRAANGGRTRRVLLSDITQKLGIAEDEAEDVYTSYQDEYYFGEAFSGVVSLSHYGIVCIEMGVLESQAPPDLVLDIQKRQELRFLLLKRLYEKTGGSIRETINFNDIAKEEGISEDDIDDFLYYLSDEGFIEPEAIGGWVSITGRGIQEIEERAVV